MTDEKTSLLLDNGQRLDGRGLNELRPITMRTGVLDRADGSCYLTWGNNKIICAVYGPREIHPKHLAKPDRAIVRVEYRLATFSVNERKSPAPRRREYELSKLISESLNATLFLEKFPNGTIDVYLTVLDADGGTRCAALTAASLALADAGIPMNDIPVACAAGKIGSKDEKGDKTGGYVVLDLGKKEDNFGDADLPIAISPRTGEIILLQMDGHLTLEEFNQALDLAIKGCKIISEIQKKALLDKYQIDYEVN